MYMHVHVTRCVVETGGKKVRGKEDGREKLMEWCQARYMQKKRGEETKGDKRRHKQTFPLT